MPDWISFAPISSIWRPVNGADLPIQFEADFVLDWTPVYLHRDEFLELLAWSDRDEIGSEGRYSLLVKYQASSDGEVDPSTPFESIRHKQGVAAEKIRLANLALWISEPTSIGFPAVIDVEQSGTNWTLRGATIRQRVTPLESYRLSNQSTASLIQAVELYIRIRDMPRDTSAWRAVRLLWSILTSPTPEQRYILLWTALEALFGPEGGQELSFRIAQRMAFFLATEPHARSECFSKAKAAYGLRSKVVHGRSLRKVSPEESDELTLESEEMLRRSLLKILDSPQILDEFSNEKRRDRYFDGLAFA